MIGRRCLPARLSRQRLSAPGPALHEIMDTAPGGEIVAVEFRAGDWSGVVEVEKCLVRNMGLKFYVDLHVGVDGGISVRDGHDIAHRSKTRSRQTDPRIADVLVHIEPASL